MYVCDNFHKWAGLLLDCARDSTVPDRPSRTQPTRWGMIISTHIQKGHDRNKALASFTIWQFLIFRLLVTFLRSSPNKTLTWRKCCYYSIYYHRHIYTHACHKQMVTDVINGWQRIIITWNCVLYHAFQQPIIFVPVLLLR